MLTCFAVYYYGISQEATPLAATALAACCDGTHYWAVRCFCRQACIPGCRILPIVKRCHAVGWAHCCLYTSLCHNLFLCLCNCYACYQCWLCFLSGRLLPFPYTFVFSMFFPQGFAHQRHAQQQNQHWQFMLRTCHRVVWYGSCKINPLAFLS